MSLFGLLRAAGGERPLGNAIGRWRQGVSKALDVLGTSGGMVVLENNQLNVDSNIVVSGVPTTLLTSSTFTLDGATSPKTALIRCGVNGRLGTGDTSVEPILQMQVSINGGAFLALHTWRMGVCDLDTQYRCCAYEATQPIIVDATAAYRLAITVGGTPTDVFTIDPLQNAGFAYMTVQISNNPSAP